MATITIRFYAELNDHLPAERRQKPFAATAGTTVRATVEALGVPFDDVDLILVNGRAVSGNHIPAEGDRISVYPVFESFDIRSLTQVRKEPLRQPRFVLDVHLGKLAYHLRMMGFDALYRNNFSGSELRNLSLSEQRALLSKDRTLVENPSLPRTYLVRSKGPREQLIEVMGRFDLYESVRPFTRCLKCNSALVHIEKVHVVDRLPVKVREKYEEFEACPTCSRVYWKGSHYDAMRNFVMEILSSGRVR